MPLEVDPFQESFSNRITRAWARRGEGFWIFRPRRLGFKGLRGIVHVGGELRLRLYRVL